MIYNNFGKVLISIGVVFVIVGLVFLFQDKINLSKFPLFKLPGDIVIKKDNFSFYFPVVSCIILSVLFTVISMIIRFFRK